MVRAGRFGWWLGWLVLVATLGAWAQDTLVVGGEAVGPYRLGGSFSRMKSSLGQPDEVRDIDAKTRLYFFRHRTMAFFVKEDRLNGITVSSHIFSTAQGLHVGATRTDVERVLGRAQSLRPLETVYPEQGLGFTYDEQGTIVKMYVTEKEARDSFKGDRSIPAGQRIGGLRIGQPLAPVLQAWGRPDQVGPLPTRPGRELVLFQDKGILLVVYQDQIEGVTSISPEYGTPDNLRVGSSKRDVLRVYGSHPVLANDIEAYKDKGIGFTYEEGKVTEITILPPGQ